MTATDEIAQTIVALLKGYLTENVPGQAGVAISSATDLTKDLSLESIQIMEYVVEIEDHYDLSIDLESLSSAKTLSDLADIVFRELN